MKRFALCLCSLLLLAACLGFTACAGEGGAVFALLSVRLKGNGDGTVTAVARNEFALGPAVLPVALTLYVLPGEDADPAAREVVGRAETDDLNFLRTVEVVAEVSERAYYYAEIVYTVYGEEQVLQSGIVCYEADGNRALET